jgi:membrane dipeptidase
MAKLTEALIAEGVSDADIGAIMGGNEVRFLMDNLPD